MFACSSPNDEIWLSPNTGVLRRSGVACWKLLKRRWVVRSYACLWFVLNESVITSQTVCLRRQSAFWTACFVWIFAYGHVVNLLNNNNNNNNSKVVFGPAGGLSFYKDRKATRAQSSVLRLQLTHAGKVVSSHSGNVSGQNVLIKLFCGLKTTRNGQGIWSRLRLRSTHWTWRTPFTWKPRILVKEKE